MHDRNQALENMGAVMAYIEKVVQQHSLRSFWEE